MSHICNRRTSQPYIKLRGYKIYHNIYPDNQEKDGCTVKIKE